MYVPGVLACSAHVEKGEKVAVSVALEQPGADGGWVVGLTRGTVLQGSQTGMDISPGTWPLFLLIYCPAYHTFVGLIFQFGHV